MTEDEIDGAKARFLDRYNSGRSQSVALSSGIEAAVQHNGLYGLSAQRGPIRSYWKSLLLQKSNGYGSPVSVSEYESDVAELWQLMNERFDGSFHEHGFRMSHAQKSLAIVLKHLWCMGNIVEPPACPVDRVVLRKAVKGPVKPWTKVDTLEEHRELFALIQAAARAAELSVAQWELLAF